MDNDPRQQMALANTSFVVIAYYRIQQSAQVAQGTISWLMAPVL
jgi:hypothetical protein